MLSGETKLIHALLLLTLAPERAAEAMPSFSSRSEQDDLISLANSHHVVIRAMSALASVSDNERKQWVESVITSEQKRINHALDHLRTICDTLESNGCPTVVIKSLDHSPDLGNDLDLFTTAPEQDVLRVFRNQLSASVQPQSWGDRLANKWNFEVPGLPESVEVHCQRIGQTGEQISLARRFVTGRVTKDVNGSQFMVPAPEERIIVSCLQRMYRHFYFRVCDIVNAAGLMEAHQIDYDELRRTCIMGGIWPGVATYLRIVRDYVAQYCERDVPLPAFVMSAARFGIERLHVAKRFIRVPIVPEGAAFYRHEIAAAARRGDVPAAFRLSLLPPLASAAALAYKLTGSDKGVW